MNGEQNKKRFCDLHTHSCFSDGTATPAAIVAQAARIGLGAVALTDHNTVAGLPVFLEAAAGTDLMAVAGVEISTGFHNKELHILGLFLTEEMFSPMTEFLNDLNHRKEASNRNLIRALSAGGYPLDYDEIRSASAGTVNRAVIAAAMMDKGYVASIKEAFRGPLALDGGYYVPPRRMCPFETISFLRRMGAVSVLAHPYLSLEEWEIEEFLPEAKVCGLVAMETRYSSYDPETTARAIAMAEKYDLLESGGSDFHGDRKPDIQLGSGKGNLEIPLEIAFSLHGRI